MPRYMYVVVRKDLPLAQQIVQAAHATHQAGSKFGAKEDDHLILIGVKNKAKLVSLAELLERDEIPFVLFNEPDYNRGWTALATKPLHGHKRLLFQKYKLWTYECCGHPVEDF